MKKKTIIEILNATIFGTSMFLFYIFSLMFRYYEFYNIINSLICASWIFKLVKEKK